MNQQENLHVYHWKWDNSFLFLISVADIALSIDSLYKYLYFEKLPVAFIDSMLYRLAKHEYTVPCIFIPSRVLLMNWWQMSGHHSLRYGSRKSVVVFSLTTKSISIVFIPLTEDHNRIAYAMLAKGTCAVTQLLYLQLLYSKNGTNC